MGVIGMGGISQAHISGIQNSEDAELVAICDIDEKVLKTKGDLYHIPENRRCVAMPGHLFISEKCSIRMNMDLWMWTTIAII